MPYKDKDKQRAAMREVMKRRRQRQKQQFDQLKLKFPDAYDMIFGKKQRKRRRKR